MSLRHPTLLPVDSLHRDIRYPAAATVLGSSHPVARAAHAHEVLARQLAATTGWLAFCIAELVHHESAERLTVLCASLVVESALIAGMTLATSCLRERARDMIADGTDALCVAEIAAERSKLASERHRAALARSLARAQHAAEHWHELAITSRPPPGVRNLAAHATTTAEVIRLIGAPAASVRAVALLDRLLRGGYAATLYTGPADVIARELGRIRYLLAQT